MNMSNDLFISEGKRKNLREKANDASQKRCNTLICVLENPSNMQNIGAIIRNINSLGVAKLCVVDEKNIFKNQSWSEMRTADTLNNTSVSAIKWTFVKVFKSSKECFDHLEKIILPHLVHLHILKEK